MAYEILSDPTSKAAYDKYGYRADVVARELDPWTKKEVEKAQRESRLFDAARGPIGSMQNLNPDKDKFDFGIFQSTIGSMKGEKPPIDAKFIRTDPEIARKAELVRASKVCICDTPLRSLNRWERRKGNCLLCDKPIKSLRPKINETTGAEKAPGLGRLLRRRR